MFEVNGHGSFRGKRMILLHKMLVGVEDEGGWGEAQVTLAASRTIYIHSNGRQIREKRYFRTVMCLCTSLVVSV